MKRWHKAAAGVAAVPLALGALGGCVVQSDPFEANTCSVQASANNGHGRERIDIGAKYSGCDHVGYFHRRVCGYIIRPIGDVMASACTSWSKTRYNDSASAIWYCTNLGGTKYKVQAYFESDSNGPGVSGGRAVETDTSSGEIECPTGDGGGGGSSGPW